MLNRLKKSPQPPADVTPQDAPNPIQDAKEWPPRKKIDRTSIVVLLTASVLLDAGVVAVISTASPGSPTRTYASSGADVRPQCANVVKASEAAQAETLATEARLGAKVLATYQKLVKANAPMSTEYFLDTPTAVDLSFAVTAPLTQEKPSASNGQYLVNMHVAKVDGKLVVDETKNPNGLGKSIQIISGVHTPSAVGNPNSFSTAYNYNIAPMADTLYTSEEKRVQTESQCTVPVEGVALSIRKGYYDQDVRYPVWDRLVSSRGDEGVITPDYALQFAVGAEALLDDIANLQPVTFPPSK